MVTLGLDVGGGSVKYAWREADGSFTCGESVGYERPTAGALGEAVRGALRGAGLMGEVGKVGKVGVCVPGVMSGDGRRVASSVNMPGLAGVDVGAWASGLGLGVRDEDVVVRTDAWSAGVDYAAVRGVKGRLMALSLGTGVGAIVLDDGVALKVSPPGAGMSSGHLGQMDVSMAVGDDGEGVPVGADGGRGSLEAYVGAAALRARLSGDLRAGLARVGVDDPAVAALVRALRIAHAIYRPDVVALLGGVGLGIGGLAGEIRSKVSEGLTGVARPGWRLEVGVDAYHAARGVARLAGEGN